MWGKLRSTVFRGAGVHAVRIENKIAPFGVPDVNYCFLNHEGGRGEGWIELKEVPRWPKKPETIIKVDHYTKDQQNWARARIAVGGTVWLLLKVGRSDWLLFWGTDAIGVVGEVNKEGLYAAATVYWSTAPKKHDLLGKLTNPPGWSKR